MQKAILSAVLVALASGLAIGTQSTLTNWAGRFIGPVRTGLLINLAGGVLATLVLLVWGIRSRSVPVPSMGMAPGVILVAAGALGVGIIAGLAFSLPRIGIAAGLATIISGQMLVAVVVDTLGWGGGGVIPLGVGRLAGLALLALGTWLILPRV